jgi:putative MATE family efflux protein
MLKKVDATQGSMIKAIITFAVPLIIASIAQQLFHITDTAVLGHMAGSVDIAAIGATGSITGLIINGVVGLSSGTTIVLARFWGEKNEKKIRSAIDTALITSLGLGVVVAVLGNIMAPFFLTATDCPSECFDGALLYIRIFISAAPITLFYNYGAAVLRTLGDTQRPLIYILTGGVINVVLNVILCLILPAKVAAVAIATVASKLVSGLLVARRLCNLEEDFARVVIRKMRFERNAFINIFRFGTPMAIAHLIMPMANLQITTAVNAYGVAAIAGNTAASSICSVVYSFCNGFSSATATFMGQNIGAKKPDRVKKAFWNSLFMSALITGALGVIVFLTGKFWVGLIVGFDEAETIKYGIIRLAYTCLPVILHATCSPIGAGLEAFGHASLRSISDLFFGLIFRVVWMQLIYPRYQTFDMVMLCFPASWILWMIYFTVCFAIIYTRYIKKGICKKI